MAVVLADGDGEILSLLTASHERDPRMKLGNLNELPEPCLKCHKVNEFADIRRRCVPASSSTRCSAPGGTLAFNRARSRSRSATSGGCSA